MEAFKVTDYVYNATVAAKLLNYSDIKAMYPYRKKQANILMAQKVYFCIN